MWLKRKKRKLQIKTESFQIAAQNNAIRTNHIKAKLDKTQQNSRYRLCGDIDEITNHIISECSKLWQKEYETRHDCVGKGIPWEFYKELKFDHTNKWHMHIPESVLKNETLNSPWILRYKRPEPIIINKKTVDFSVPAGYNKIERKKDKYLDFAKELKKKQTMEHENGVNTNSNWVSWFSHQRIDKKTGGLGNNRSGDHLNYSIIKIGQNTEKSLGDLRRLAVSQTPLKDHQLMLMWQTLRE